MPAATAVAATFLALPALLLWMVSLLFLTTRPFLIIEFALLAFLIPVAPPIVLSFGFLLLLVIEVALAISPIYHLTWQSLLTSVSDIAFFDWRYLAGLLSLLLIVGCIFRWATSRYRRDHPGLSGLLPGVIATGFVFVLQVAELSAGQNWVATTGAEVRRFVMFQADSKRSSGTYSLMKSATAPIFERISNNTPLPKHILVVVVESMGVASSAINELQHIGLIESGIDRNKYSSEQLAISHEGSTVPGEIRELCQKSMSGTIPDIAKLELRFCLPALLESKGYTSFAYHGYVGSFFNRIQWYRDIGFDEVLFAAQLESKVGQRRCGFLLFQGVCDSDVAGRVASRFKQSESPLFGYWLTLNGHQPVLGPPSVGRFKRCADMDVPSDRLCWTIQHAQVVINEVITIAKTIDDIGIVLVGDHKPATGDTTFTSNKVAAIVLWPRGN